MGLRIAGGSARRLLASRFTLMISCDAGIIHFLNSFSRKSPLLDHVVSFLGDSNLLKGGIIVALLWMLWLQPSAEIARRRRAILSTLAGCAVAILAARLLAGLLPFRDRPMNDVEFSFLTPFGYDPHALEGWSSFPSDHAALFFGLAAGFFPLSKKIGWFVLLHAIFIVSLPRLYLGIHFPTDIIAGAILGASLVRLANRPSLADPLARIALGWLERSPASFHVCFFLTTFQIAVLFDDVRALGHLVVDAARYLTGRGKL